MIRFVTLSMVCSLAVAQTVEIPLSAVTTTSTGSVDGTLANAVQVEFNSGQFSDRGSGIYLGSGLVATAWHVARDSGGRGCSVRFRDGQALAGQVIQKDTVHDQCLIEVSGDPGLGSVPIAESDPVPGDELIGAGFARGFRAWRGRVTGFSSSNGGGNWDTVVYRGINGECSVSGDSGGPTLNARGQVVGCLWGATAGETYGATTRRFRTFLGPVLARLGR
jgi:S1-C subfamily serine protease